MKQILFAIAATIFLIPLLGCNKRKSIGDDARETFTIRKVDLRDVFMQTGEVQPVVKVELKSESSGKIEKIHVKEGQEVKKGDTLLIIDPERLLTTRQKKILTVKKAALDRTIAQRDYKNAQKMAETGTVSPSMLEDLKTKYESADIFYQLEQLELKDVQDQLKRTVITSPMDGIITSLLVKEGEIAVSATSGFQNGTAIGTIANISELEVITEVGEVDYIHVKKGQSVTIRPETIEGAETRGTVTFVAMSASKKNNQELGSFEVRVSVDSIIPGIAPGINVNVEFVLLEKHGALGVPNHFITKSPKGSMVQLLKKGPDGKEKMVPQKITVGATDFHHYEILSGLSEGDVVVFAPQASPDGKRNRPQGGGRGRR